MDRVQQRQGRQGGATHAVERFALTPLTLSVECVCGVYIVASYSGLSGDRSGRAEAEGIVWRHALAIGAPLVSDSALDTVAANLTASEFELAAANAEEDAAIRLYRRRTGRE